MKKHHQPTRTIITARMIPLEEKIAQLDSIGIIEIYDHYKVVIDKELQERGYPVKNPEILYNTDLIFEGAQQILEIAENSTIMRCCGKNGHVTEEKVAFESDAAHANLVSEIVDFVLDIIYGWGNDTARYTRYELTKVARYHDLPENETGDGEDNMTRDETEKAKQEDEYFNHLAKFHSTRHGLKFFRLVQLFKEMREQNTEEGRILYLSDKLAAIIMALCYFRIGINLYALEDDPSTSEINRAEMKYCDEKYQNGYYFSEIWTNDFLFARELTRYDDYGLFTALLVMVTLICRNNRWYDWRMNQHNT